ncbi:MAG: hypothetical protein Q7U60_04980 [Candidatus Methanoperedens sp.]|nr:hypothetical protein [Candidatus Methanoperedens sp.]
MATRRDQVIAEALKILEGVTAGIRYSNMMRELYRKFPEYPPGTIHGSVWDLPAQMPDVVYKPARGLFKLVKYKSENEVIPAVPPSIQVKVESKGERITEENFYKSFADWIVNDLEECTKAIPLGGSKFKDKWGTPDVVGIMKPKTSDIIKPSIEIVSAEIKIDGTGLITAFGQACSYKLFSHKVYIVIPNDSAPEDIGKLDALSLILGIGLILFDRNDTSDPKYEIKTRALKHEPDMFYVNKYMKFIADDLFD